MSVHVRPARRRHAPPPLAPESGFRHPVRRVSASGRTGVWLQLVGIVAAAAGIAWVVALVAYDVAHTVAGAIR